jgi:hypothetical protein
MRLVLIAIAALLAAAACGAYAFPGASSTTANGTVRGQVSVVPCAPVEQAGQPCTGKAVEGLALDFTSGSTTITGTTDASGNYTVELAAGTWQVSVKNYMRIVSGPHTITVHAGDNIVANYVIDSGIRVPIAAS